MKVRLARKGAPSKEVRELVAKFNDYLDSASAEDKIRYGKDYSTVEDIRDAYAQATGNKVDINSADNIEKNDYYDDAKVVNESFKASDSIPEGFDLDPNAEPVIQREYNKDITDPNIRETVSEPIYTTDPTYSQHQQEQEQQQASGNSQPQAEANNHEPQPANPAMNDLDDKAKRIAAEQMVDMVLGVYEKAHEWVKPLAKVKTKKLAELEAKGLIDPTDQIPVDENGTGVTAREFVNETNQKIDEILTPDPTFNGKVRPAMVREFTKRGYGLTDMQYIIMMFGQDIVTKGAMIVGMRKQMGAILDIYKEQQKERKSIIESQNVKSVTPDSISQGHSNPEPTVEVETEPIY